MAKPSVAPKPAVPHDPARSVKEIAAMVAALRDGVIVQKWKPSDRRGLSLWLARALRSQTRKLLAEMKKAV